MTRLMIEHTGNQFCSAARAQKTCSPKSHCGEFSSKSRSGGSEFVKGTGAAFSLFSVNNLPRKCQSGLLQAPSPTANTRTSWTRQCLHSLSPQIRLQKCKLVRVLE